MNRDLRRNYSYHHIDRTSHSHPTTRHISRQQPQWMDSGRRLPPPPRASSHVPSGRANERPASPHTVQQPETPRSPHFIPPGALQEAQEELREVMIQYSNCADPTESATRKERCCLFKSVRGYKGNQLGSKGSYVPKPNNIAQRSTGQQWKTSPHNYNKENAIAHVVNDALVSPNMHMGSHTTYSALPRSSLDLSSFSVEQGISYAKLANLPPIVGLYSSFVPPLIYSVLGSSKHLAVGPVSIASLVMGSMLSESVSPTQDSILYLKLAFTSTFFAGLFQASLGLLRLGFVIDFLSKATLVGFTAGAAVIVSLQQLKGLLGIVHFTGKMQFVPVMILRWTREEENRIKENNDRNLKCIILDMTAVSSIDTSGIEAVFELRRRLEKQSLQLVLVNPVGSVMEKLHKSKIIESLGLSGLYLTVGEAVSDLSSTWKAHGQP
ncbi:hypothetical protein F2Q70_00023330 [Brassica cretica]|uniref:STAS domain-containing protein n=1 Tax=Brassica cretica TaxID=69181 RepID=A0A8S9GPI5_BRACR|nr:hypothetical protein F2Q70_00023330 [Brassica cretica]